MENMNCLKDLYVSLMNKDEIIDLQPISSPPKCLEHLKRAHRQVAGLDFRTSTLGQIICLLDKVL